MRISATHSSREYAVDLTLLLAAKAALGAWVLHLGFSHVSDDDYARVVIAQLFVHSPKLDPSGTSWLPFPFWVTGGAMAVVGRTLATARTIAFALGLLSVIPPYIALRAMGAARVVAIASSCLAAALPWNAWLGVATVPEALTAALIAAGAFSLSSARTTTWGTLMLFAASLSRYEAWPVCALAAIVCALRLLRHRDVHRVDHLLALVFAIAGPALWMAWNAHAHGGAFHFFARVARYHDAMGGAMSNASDKLLLYPRALVDGAPWAPVLGVLGLVGFIDGTFRKRWTLPLAAAASVLAFLIYGELRGGAPTHHPERALLAVWCMLVPFGVDAARSLVLRTAWGHSGREAWLVGLATTAGMFGGLHIVSAYASYPGATADERRDSQIARGLDLRAHGVRDFSVTPCRYEHFALMAAYGAPETVEVRPASNDGMTAACPHVDVPVRLGIDSTIIPANSW